MTRRVSFLFYVSLLGCVSILSVFGYRYWTALQIRNHKTAEAAEAERVAKQEKETEVEERLARVISLGTFMIELTERPDLVGNRKTTNLALVDVVLICDSKATREIVEESLPLVRDRLTNMFTPLTRDELLSTEGKLRLRRYILKTVNDWLQGEVEKASEPHEASHANHAAPKAPNKKGPTIKDVYFPKCIFS